MNIVAEIREAFASMNKNGVMNIESLPQEYPALVIRTMDEYGVAIEVDDSVEVAERFNSCRFRTSLISVNDIPHNYLMLSSSFEEYRHEFATLCARFVEPGDDGCERKLLLQNPHKWWTKWKELVGNTNKDQRVYDVIAEMIVLDYKFKSDRTVRWASSQMGSHDIECETESCEVKSTVKRYGTEIVISGQHQLLHDKPLYLYFCRMEESLDGVSINDVEAILIKDGFDSGNLERIIQNKGFERGANIRNKKYKILEKRKYVVDENFPRITAESFKGDQYPFGVTHIQYTIDLDALPYVEW